MNKVSGFIESKQAAFAFEKLEMTLEDARWMAARVALVACPGCPGCLWLTSTIHRAQVESCGFVCAGGLLLVGGCLEADLTALP